MSPEKSTLTVDDSILKHVEGWHLNKSMKFNVSVKSIPGASTNGMIQHVKRMCRGYFARHCNFTSWGK